MSRGRKVSRGLGVAVACLLVAPAPAAAQSGMRKFLEGCWAGDGLQICVDQDAVQANDNPGKPFEWSAFTIRDVTGQMIVFQVGPRQYIGLIDGEQMTVTVGGGGTSYVLRKATTAPMGKRGHAS